MSSRWLPLVLLVGLAPASCMRAGFQQHASTQRTDAATDTAQDAPADVIADAALTPRAQSLSILTTKDDGEISGGMLLFSGETWWGNLIHVGSWATGTGAPTMSYAFLRYRLKTAIPAQATVTDLRVRLYGHALTGGSKWDPTKHKLIISADHSPDAAQVSSKLGYPGGTAGVAQTKALVDWLDLVWKVDAWNESPNLAPLVQEIVDAHGGLKAGAYIQLWLRAPMIYPVDAEVPFEDLDNPGGRAAEAALKWSEPS